VLQDKLPPFPDRLARAEVERELERPIDEMFSSSARRSRRPRSRRCIRRPTRDRPARGGQDPAPGHRARLPRDVDAFYFIARTIELLAPFVPPPAPLAR
jgi:ubiquinone biosynthesis protein